MKINSNAPRGLPPTVSNRPASGGADGAAGSPAQGKPQSINLSPAARALSQLDDGSADINQLRVDEIRDALTSGKLKIDPQGIADGLIDSARELLKDA